MPCANRFRWRESEFSNSENIGDKIVENLWKTLLFLLSRVFVGRS
jgi:hypothetical protein